MLDGKKKCARCKIVKSLDLFYTSKKSKSDTRSYCKKCCNDDKLKRDFKNRKKYTCKNCFIKLEKFKFYCEKCSKLRKKKQKCVYMKTYRDKPIRRLKETISATIFIMLKNNNSSKNGRSILQFLPYTIKVLKSHIESQFELWMNWENWGLYKASEWDDNDSSTWKWQVDHIIPHSTFKYTSMEDQAFKDCWALSNLRPYCAKQNLLDGSKRTRHNMI